MNGLKGKLLDNEIGALGAANGREHEISKVHKEDMLGNLDEMKEAQLKIAKETQKRVIALAKEEAEAIVP